MRLDSNCHYILRDGSLAHIEKFFPGTETQPACFWGAIAGKLASTTWFPHGAHVENDNYDIVRRAKPREIEERLEMVGYHLKDDDSSDADISENH